MHNSKFIVGCEVKPQTVNPKRWNGVVIVNYELIIMN